jgi:hypothetical protein
MDLDMVKLPSNIKIAVKARSDCVGAKAFMAILIDETMTDVYLQINATVSV